MRSILRFRHNDDDEHHRAQNCSKINKVFASFEFPFNLLFCKLKTLSLFAVDEQFNEGLFLFLLLFWMALCVIGPVSNVNNTCFDESNCTGIEFSLRISFSLIFATNGHSDTIYLVHKFAIAAHCRHFGWRTVNWFMERYLTSFQTQSAPNPKPKPKSSTLCVELSNIDLLWNIVDPNDWLRIRSPPSSNTWKLNDRQSLAYRHKLAHRPRTKPNRNIIYANYHRWNNTQTMENAWNPMKMTQTWVTAKSYCGIF